jgi:hypothetical protein
MTAVRKVLLTSAATVLVASGLLVTGSAAHADDSIPSDAPAASEIVGSSAPSSAQEGGSDAAGANVADAVPADDADLATAEKAAGEPKNVAPRAATIFGTLKASPAGPYRDGQSVKLTYTGFPANSQIVASTCVGGITLGGPGDCAPLNGPGSAVTAADGKGAGSVSIKVVKGALGATDKPAAKCSNKASEPCVFSLTDFSGNGPATIKVTYVEAAAPAPAGDTGNDDAPASGDDGDNGATDGNGSDADSGEGSGSTGAAPSGASTTGGTGLAATGAGPASDAAMAGYALVVLGVALLLFTRRTSAGAARR